MTDELALQMSHRISIQYTLNKPSTNIKQTHLNRLITAEQLQSMNNKSQTFSTVEITKHNNIFMRPIS